MKEIQRETYTKKVDGSGCKLIVFYEEKAIVDGSSWSLNSFLNHHEFDIQEVTFVQGMNKSHDSFHIWYKKMKQTD